jgi:hypothetical protein
MRKISWQGEELLVSQGHLISIDLLTSNTVVTLIISWIHGMYVQAYVGLYMKFWNL